MATRTASGKAGIRRTAAPARASVGVVDSIVAQPRRGKRSSNAPTAPRLIEAVRAGLPASELFELKAALDVPNEALAPMAGMSKATLGRRRPDQRLSPEEGDRVVRFARLLGLAVDVMGDLEHARRWMKSPQVGLGGSTPLDYALTEIGAREVEDLLGRIEHGVYS